MSIYYSCGDRMYDNMILYTKYLKDDIDDWWISGKYEITAKLKNEDLYIYDDFYKSGRVYRLTDDSEEIEWRKEFSIRLRKRMEWNDISQEELAENIGTTQSVISRYINGTSLPSLRRIKQIANYIRCDVEELIP